MTTFGDQVFQFGGVPVGGGDWLLGVANTYFVDVQSGNDGNIGDNWNNALATIARAITLSNATIDWSATPKRYNAILIAPGVYPEALTTLPYYCHVIGMGIRGTDTAAEIHPVTGSVMAGTGLGLHLQNLRLETNEALPILDFGICNNTIIEDCTFTNGAAVAATGIDTENCTHLTVQRCSFESGQTTGLAYGFYFRGGANKFAHNVRIQYNKVLTETAGIWIENTCTASQCVIGPGNFIARPVKGIDDNSGQSYVFDNFICASSDAIEHANSASHCVGNYVINDATGAVETTHV